MPESKDFAITKILKLDSYNRFWMQIDSVPKETGPKSQKYLL